MRPLIRILLFTGVLAMAACSALMQPRLSEPAPWVPADDLPEPGEQPLWPQN